MEVDEEMGFSPNTRLQKELLPLKKKRKSEAEKKEDEKRPRFGNGFDFGGGGAVFVCFVRESSYKGRAEILHGWSKGIDEERREVIIYH